MVDQIKNQKELNIGSRPQTEPHIVYLGETGFPLGFAAIQRQALIAKGLIAAGCKVTVISFKGSHSKDKDFPPSGTKEGISYRYASGDIHRPESFLRRNFQKIKGRIGEWVYLRQQKKRLQLDYALISSMHFGSLLWYSIILKVLRVPAILSLVELNSAIVSRKKLGLRINDFLVDRYAVSLFDGVLPISDYLMQHSKDCAPGKPTFKAPIICDFSEFDIPADEKEGVRFVYCGAPRYFQLIKFVLEAFDMVQFGNQQVSLDFILGGGTSAEIEQIKIEVSRQSKKDRIRLFRNVPRSELIQLYRNATALLIPLRPSLQDRARFPHKLGEYLASGRAVITTAYGEINSYNFIDKRTALVAEEYKSDAFGRKMQWVIDHPSEAGKIGEAGRQMGLVNFSHLLLGEGIKQFLLSLGRSESKKPVVKRRMDKK